MGKKLDKKAKAAEGKAPKGMKVDKAVKKFRKLEGKLWTREYQPNYANTNSCYRREWLLHAWRGKRK